MPHVPTVRDPLVAGVVSAQDGEHGIIVGTGSRPRHHAVGGGHHDRVDPRPVGPGRRKPDRLEPVGGGRNRSEREALPLLYLPPDLPYPALPPHPPPSPSPPRHACL